VRQLFFQIYLNDYFVPVSFVLLSSFALSEQQLFVLVQPFVQPVEPVVPLVQVFPSLVVDAFALVVFWQLPLQFSFPHFGHLSLIILLSTTPKFAFDDFTVEFTENATELMLQTNATNAIITNIFFMRYNFN